MIQHRISMICQSIGFDWAWQNAMYFTGAYMTKYLVSHGRNLRDYLTKRPTAFMRDYLEVCRQNHCHQTISQSEAEDVKKLDSALAAPVQTNIRKRPGA
jgi:hypothetical protein